MRKWYWAAGLFLFAQAADIWTTMLSGGEESNPFMRDASYQPVLRRVLFEKSMLSSMALLVALVCWKLWDHPLWRQTVSVALIGWMVYWSYNMLQAALVNYSIHIGWFQP